MNNRRMYRKVVMSMATATKIHTSTDAKTRSLELAQARGETSCSHSAKTLGWALGEDGQLVSLALEIRSAHSDTAYAVGYLAATDDASCDCTAASYGRPCWHRGLAIICGREVARCYSPAGRCEALQEQRAADRADQFDTSAGQRGATSIVREAW